MNKNEVMQEIWKDDDGWYFDWCSLIKGPFESYEDALHLLDYLNEFT